MVYGNSVTYIEQNSDMTIKVNNKHDIGGQHFIFLDKLRKYNDCHLIIWVLSVCPGVNLRFFASGQLNPTTPE